MYIVSYMVWNFVLRRWYISPNENFDYCYPHSNTLFNIYTSEAQHFAPNWSLVSDLKQLRQPITSHVFNDVGAPTLYRRIYWCKFLTLSNQTSRYIGKCIKICDYWLTVHSRHLNQPHVSLDFWHNVWPHILKCKMSLSTTPQSKSFLAQQRLRSALHLHSLIRFFSVHSKDSKGTKASLCWQQQPLIWSAQADQSFCSAINSFYGFVVLWFNLRHWYSCLTFEPRHEKTCFAICEQQRCRSACISTQSDQHLYYSLLR